MNSKILYIGLLLLTSIGFAQQSVIPRGDTKHYLWITFFNDPIITPQDNKITVQEDSFIRIEQSTPRELSTKADVWIYNLDSLGETLLINNQVVEIDLEARAWIEASLALAQHNNEPIITDYQNSSLEWFWKIDQDKGFISVANWHSPEQMTSWYASDVLDGLPERSTDDLRIEVLAFRHLTVHHLLDRIVLLDSSSELFDYDAEYYAKDIALGYLLAAQELDSAVDRLEVWKDFQPYLNR
jgi:hypothetical protein